MTTYAEMARKLRGGRDRPEVDANLLLMGFLIAAVAITYADVDERAASRFESKAFGYGAQPDAVFSKIFPKFMIHVLVRSRYSVFDAVRKSGTSDDEWEWVPDAVQEVARLYNTNADLSRFVDLAAHIENRWERAGGKIERPWDVIAKPWSERLRKRFLRGERGASRRSPGEPRTGKKELQQAARIQVSSSAGFTALFACWVADPSPAQHAQTQALQFMMSGAVECAGFSALAKSWSTSFDRRAIAQAEEAQRVAIADYANELLSLLSEASVKGVRAGHVSEKEQQYLNPRKRVRNDMPSAGSMGRKVWAKMRSKKRFSLHDASKATGLSEVKVRVAVGWLKEHGYLRAEGEKYVPSHASFRVNPEPGVADCREAWESYCEKPGLEIAACREAWEHYCARPNKTRLRAVLKILEGMKGSKSAKIRAERTRCLRAAKPEAKALGL